MRILVFANTPAHVHQYRNAVDRLEDAGHDVLVLTREYACTTALLDYFELPYRIYGTHETAGYSTIDFVTELAGQLRSIATESRRFDPDVVFGRGPYAGAAGTLTRTPIVLVLDDEPGDFNHTISRPFADCILSPAVTRRDFGETRYTFEGFKECAYLHPDVFERDAGVRDALGVEPDERYVLVRFNALDALHDAGIEGFSPAQRRDLIDRLADRVTVFISDEGGEMAFDGLPAHPYDLHPALLHDTMAEAALVVADTGTVVTEAALLGTPAFRYRGTDDHEYGEFQAVEDAGLAEQFDDYDRLRSRAIKLLGDDAADRRWQHRRQEFVADLVNLTDVLVDVAQSRGAIDRLDSTTRRSLRPRSSSV